jgi:septal ring-binding cell division protein DamX
MIKKIKKSLNKYALHLVIIGVLILLIIFLISYFKQDSTIDSNINNSNAAQIIYSNGKEVQ